MDRSTSRLLIVVVLAVVGGLVLANGFGDDGAPSAAASPSATPSASVTPTDGGTETPPPDTVEPQDPSEVEFVALNGTDVDGLAAAAEGVLLDAGYVAGGEPGDAPQKGVAKTTVYYREGKNDNATAQNQANAEAIKKLFKGSQVAQLSDDYDDIVPASATIVVVVGENNEDELTS